MDEVKETNVTPVAEEKPKAKPKKQKPKDDFVTRKLKVINSMNNPAKATRLAERVLSNRKVGK